MGVMYFCVSTPATVAETDAAKPASEQDLSGRTARCCSVASLTNATWSAQEPYDHKRISGATDYQGHHGMKPFLFSPTDYKGIQGLKITANTEDR